MILQKRDLDILRWVNGFGFASAEQIKKFMNVGSTASYVRIKKLVEGGYLARQRLMHNQARVHKLTAKGKAVCNDVIVPPNYINLGTFRHDYILIDLAIWLEGQTGRHFVPPRRIRHDEGLSGVGQIGHIPDGYLEIDNDKPIAIELELSVKSHIRIKNIINDYEGNLSIKEVWYYTDRKDVARAIEKVAHDFTFIKVFDVPKEVGCII